MRFGNSVGGYGPTCASRLTTDLYRILRTNSQDIENPRCAHPLRREILHESSAGCQAVGYESPRSGAQKSHRASTRALGPPRCESPSAARLRSGIAAQIPMGTAKACHARSSLARISQQHIGLAPDRPLAPHTFRFWNHIGVEPVLHPVVAPKLSRMLRTLRPVAATHRVGRTIMHASPADSLGMPRMCRYIACHERSVDLRASLHHYGKYARKIIRTREAAKASNSTLRLPDRYPLTCARSRRIMACACCT